MKRLGCGFGLRKKYHQHLTECHPPISWLQISSEEYMDTAGESLLLLEKLKQQFPVALQGRSLSIGSSDPLNEAYLKSLQALIRRVQPVMVCDHLCWSGTDQNYLHELLPLPLNRETFDYVAERVSRVQDMLQQRLTLGNITHYMRFRNSDMAEGDFLNLLSEKTGCGIALDISSVYINSVNYGTKALEYIRKIRHQSVDCVHVSGFTDTGKWLLDSRNEPVDETVWDLYQETLKITGKLPTIIENNQPLNEFEDLTGDFSRAAQIYAAANDTAKKQSPVKAGTLKQKQGSSESRISLAEAQRWVKSNVFKIETNRKSDLTAEEVLLEPIEDHLRVYEMGYLNRIAETLIQVYPSIFHMLGEHSFKVLAYEYAAEYRSRSYNVQRCGDRFPEFLKNHPVTERLPFLPDLGELERKILHCYHANDTEPVGADILSRYAPEDWERLTFQFQPSFDLFESDWPVADMWQERNAHESEHLNSKIGESQKIMIYRNGHLPDCKNVDNEIAWSILKHMYRGKTLGETLEIVGSEGESVLADLSSYFQVWTEGGIFCGVEAV